MRDTILPPLRGDRALERRARGDATGRGARRAPATIARAAGERWDRDCGISRARGPASLSSTPPTTTTVLSPGITKSFKL